MSYHPESYWSKVATRIKDRDGNNVIAGDDEPYYRYKRKEFIKLLHSVDFAGKTVLEIGSGPGGNLVRVLEKNPKKLTGADISAEMVKLAKTHVPAEVDIVKVDGNTLPFADNSMDIVFTATVLQHNTDEKMLKKVMKEIARVAKNEVYLFERIESEILGDELCYGRPVEYYAAIMDSFGFKLAGTDFINVRTSYYVSGAIRKGLNPKAREEGEAINSASVLLQNITLPFTKVLDKIFKSPKDVGKLRFVPK